MDSTVKKLDSDMVSVLSNPKSSPERNLAIAVVSQAFIDCRHLLRAHGLGGVRGSEPYMSLAYPTGAMRMWCEMADIDPDAMAERVRRGMRTEKGAAEMLSRLSGKSTREAVNG